jgi:hypothetical protein
VSLLPSLVSPVEAPSRPHPSQAHASNLKRHRTAHTQYRPVRYRTDKHHTTPHNTTQHHTTPEQLAIAFTTHIAVFPYDDDDDHHHHRYRLPSHPSAEESALHRRCVLSWSVWLASCCIAPVLFFWSFSLGSQKTVKSVLSSPSVSPFPSYAALETLFSSFPERAGCPGSPQSILDTLSRSSLQPHPSTATATSTVPAKDLFSPSRANPSDYVANESNYFHPGDSRSTKPSSMWM